MSNSSIRVSSLNRWVSMGSNKIKEAFSELHLMGDILLYDTIRKWNHRYCSNIGISEDNYTNNAAERLKQSLWYILLESMTIIMFDNIPYFTLILMVESDWLFECGVTSVIKHAAERVFLFITPVFYFFGMWLTQWDWTR